METRLTKDEIIVRVFVESIRQSDIIRISSKDSDVAIIPDNQLKWELGLILKEYYKRTGKIRRQL